MKLKKPKLRRAVKNASLFLAATAAIGLRNPKIEGNNIIDIQLPDEIRVMSANLGPFRYFGLFSELPKEGLYDLEDLVREKNIDLSCFQEAEITFDEEQHRLPHLISRTDLKNYVFSPNFIHNFLGFVEGGQGNAVLSRFPLYEPQRISLDTYKSVGGAAIAKIFIGAKAILHTKLSSYGYPINVLCTHLSNWDTEFSGGHERDTEFKALFEYAAQHTPAIIIGDFNTVPLSSQRKKFWDYDYSREKGWLIVKEIIEREGLDFQYDPRLHLFDADAEQTFPGTHFDFYSDELLGKENNHEDDKHTLDYILVINHPDDGLKLTLQETEVENSRYYSDHFPVWATIRIEKK